MRSLGRLITSGVATLLVSLAVVAPAAAQDTTAISFPKYTGLVVDAANVLPQATRADLTAKLDKLQHDTKRQLVVATIPDLQGRDIADYGYRLGREWGVGLRDVNDGVVLIVAPVEHKLRIEVGYGLEPVLTDALTSVIVNQDMTPRLKAGDLPGGVEAGADAIIAQLRASPDEAKARTDAAVAAFDKTHRQAGSRGGSGFPIGLVFWALVIGFVLLSRRRGAGGRAYSGGGGLGGGLGSAILWGSILGGGRGGGSSGGGGGDESSGGSSGGWGDGGFSGGGGGSFGGGGASGSW